MIHQKKNLNMFYKNINLIAVFLLTFNSISGMKIENKSLFVPSKLGNISIFHQDSNFIIKKGPRSYTVKNYLLDQKLRNISEGQLSHLINSGAYLSVNHLGEGEYSLKLNFRLRGGGAGGATTGFYLGKFTTYFVAYGAIAIISACTGPAAPATAGALASTLAPFIEGASNVVAISSAVVGGVATGPV